MTSVSQSEWNEVSSKSSPRRKTQQFQEKCSECLILLEQYKLKTNMAGCNMTIEEVKKYYNYYESKSRKRLQICRERLEGLKKAYERNFAYLQALELKTINNMMKVFRKRMDVIQNEPTDYRLLMFQEDEEMLSEWILSSDYTKINDINKLITKIKTADSKAGATMEKMLFDNKGKKPNIGKAFKTINKSQTVYCRYMENFQRSVSNMVNQIHSHIEKLTQFYNMWENLGSSLIYQMKSDREVLIDKTLEERRNRNYCGLDQTEEEILQVIQVMPANSKMREVYQQKYEDLKAKQMKNYSNHTNTHFNTVSMASKHKKGNLKLANQNIVKVSWYETEAEDIKEHTFNDSMILREREQGYFRYTYEELHHETIDYLDSLKNKKGQGDNSDLNSKENYFDRFYVFCDKKDKAREDSANNMRIQKSDTPPYMSFSCWFDRLGSKGAFSVQDFPINIFQRKLQFESDRQVEMSSLDQNRRKQYNNKQSKLHSITDQSFYNLGYKELDPRKQAEKLRLELTKLYDAEYLPKPKNEKAVIEKKKLKVVEDFSQSEAEQDKAKAKAPKQSEEKSETKSPSKSKLQQLQPKSPTKQKKAIAESQTFLNEFQTLEKVKKSNQLNQQRRTTFKQSVNQLQKAYPWLEVKENSKETFEVFVERYLPQLQKAIIAKMKIEVQNLGYTEEEIEVVSYKYLSGSELQTITTCIMESNKQINKAKSQITIEKENINKMYLVNKQFYVKIDPIFFHNSNKVIKIDIVMASDVHLFEKLKSNLQSALSKYGRCNFHLNMQLAYQNEGLEEKMYSLIGYLLRDQKLDKSLKSILAQDEKNVNFGELIKEGQKIFQSFDSHYRNCIQVEKEKI